MSFAQPPFKLKASSVLILIGVIMLGYVGVQYGAMYVQQQKLEREWQVQQNISTSDRLSATLASHDGLTRLVIPKIELSAVVVEGTGHKELLLGPGHMLRTAIPGTLGNSVITAHRDTFFRHIVDLNKGDAILVQRSGQTYSYEVAFKKIVKPTSTYVARPSTDARLTLITCYPIHYIGPAPERLVIVCKLVSPPVTKLAARVESAAAPALPVALPKDNSRSSMEFVRPQH